ncbi:MAG: carboxymuconolactone decarboxylase family protein [Gemmatimonadota bacterium]|nr:carboxymuconolactone decarboxylase family protein [Gemmatimonadota bacterium]
MGHVPYDPSVEGAPAWAAALGRLGWAGSPSDHILRLHALDPPSLEHHVRLYEHAMRGPSPLSRIQREMLAVVVSAANDCFY